MKLLEIISESLHPKANVSNMRLNSTMIILTGCFSMVVITILFAIALFNGKVGVSEIIAFGTVLTSFTGIGIWGKAAQKKTEVQQSNSQDNG